MSKTITGPFPPEEMHRFLRTYFYKSDAVMVDEILELDSTNHCILAQMNTDGVLPYSALQRQSADHPPHVSAADMIMATGSLGSLHAWFFHGCRWDEGWAGFGSRIHRADFKSLAHIGPPIELRSSTLKARAGKNRVILRLTFEFRQEEKLVYKGEQSAIFVKEHKNF